MKKPEGMTVTGTFTAITYEEARYDFFLLKKHAAERKLEWYRKRLKRARGHWSMHLQEVCSNLGWEINYYDDAMKAFKVSI